MKLKKKVGIRVKLIASLLLFTTVILLVLWLLEVVFLDEIYQKIKIRSISGAADRFAGYTEEEIPDYVTKLANSHQICCAVYDKDLNILASEHAGGECVVHRIFPASVETLYLATKENAGQSFSTRLSADQILSVLRRSGDAMNPFDSHEKWESERIAVRPDNSYDCYFLSRITKDADGNEIYILLSTVLIPVDSTVSTIRFELNVVIAFLVLFSVLLGFILSRTISRPLMKLTAASKELPSGKFDASGIGGYREVDELSRTLGTAAEEIRKVDHLRKELIANVSHDLRTPLTLISGYSEVMRDIPGENTPENLQVIIDETQRLSRLVNDMLDLSKMEAGMDQLKTEEIDLVLLVRGILDRYKKLVDHDGYVIRFEHDNESVFVQADETKLGQVIYNLVNNAIHYGGEDKTVIVRQKMNGNAVRIEITDHGEGIEEEKIREIWDRYYRIDKNHKSAVVGSGLGLSIVKTALEMHHARFGVQSKVGEGSTFWFELPLNREK